MGKVSIVRINDDIKNSLHRSLNLIGGIKNYINSDDRVLLKPNLNGSECCTNINLVEALIQLLNDHNIKDVFIAESTFGNQQITQKLFHETGYSDLAEKYNIDLINLNASEPIDVEVRNPLILNKIKIAKEVFSADKIINIPVMKVHYATGITLALKNLKGFLTPDEKIHFHEVGVDKAIVDLNNIIKVHLNIIDCITCMEAMGPRGGEIFNLNLIIAGENRAEVDYIGSKVMGYELNEVKHLKYFTEYHNIDLSKIELLGEKLESVIRPFKKVNLQNILPPNINIHNKNACSSCMNALLLSFRLLERELKDEIHIYLGALLDQKNITNGLRIAFGNCCKNNDVDTKVKGCPPYPYLLKRMFE